MCGIAAIVSFSGPRCLTHVARMVDAVSHRGPDDEGLKYLGLGEAGQPAGLSSAFAARGSLGPMPENSTVPEDCMIALGHRRLSIFDLSAAGRQPMTLGDTGLWIVYNGAVYNFLELRDRLMGMGYEFRSQTDTEVILAAYDAWGESCLEKFNGMWAFVLIDTKSGIVFASRDRFGIKSLYVYECPGRYLAFASEIKQFTMLPEWKARLCPQRGYDFLAHGLFDHTRETLFQRVNQLRGGESLMITLNTPHRRDIKVWYSLPETTKPVSISLTEASERFMDLLIDAVRLRLRSDVPVGSCLSGGLDSSTIVCIANRILKSRGASGLQETFSSCFDLARYDERPYVQAVARRIGVEPNYTFPTLSGLFNDLDDLLWYHDEPFGSTSIYAQWCVFRLTQARGVKVMLDGQGADEQLAGYHGFHGPHLSALLVNGRIGRLAREVRLLRQRHGYNLGYAIKGLAGVLLLGRLRRAAFRLKGLPGKGIAPPWLSIMALKKAGVRLEDLALDLGAIAVGVKRVSMSQLRTSCLSMLLHHEDRNAMAHGVESRVPFLDYRLVEFVISLPDEYKLWDGESKVVLRRATNGLLPEVVRRRQDKMGFVTPEEIWIRQAGTAEFRREIESAVEAAPTWFNGKVMLGWFDAVVSGKRPFKFDLWRVVCFGRWIRRFNVQFD